MGNPRTREDHANEYINKKLRVFPLQPRSKSGQILSSWAADAACDAAKAQRWWGHPGLESRNIAIALGAETVVVDLDEHNPEASGSLALSQLVTQHGPLPDTWCCTTPTHGKHYYFRNDGEPLKNRTGFRPGLDCKTTGGYVVAPPSNTENGSYSWEPGCAPWECEIAPLPEWLRTVIQGGASNETPPQRFDRTTQVGAAEVCIPEGERNTTLFKRACSLRGQGYSEEAILAAIRVENEKKCSTPLPASEVEKLCRSAAGFEPGEWDTTPDWYVPEPLVPTDIPDFPVDALPNGVREYVRALAESSQTPATLGGSLALGVLATCFQSKIKYVQINQDWREPLCLFTAAVAEPGERKSAVFSALTKPLRTYEKQRQDCEADHIARSKAEKEVLELEVAKARKAIEKTPEDESVKERFMEASVALGRFSLAGKYRLIADDATPEKLTDLMHENSETMAVFSSEGGVFNIMNGRYTKTPNYDIFLKGHAGDPVSVDRIGRNTLRLSEPRLTLALAIQPKILTNVMSDPELRGVGMCARFLYGVCRRRVGYRKCEDNTVPQEVKTAYDRTVSDYLDSPEGVECITLSPEARELLRDYQEEIEANQREGGRLDGLRDWSSKLPGAVARIAGLFHAAEHTNGAGNTPISAGVMQRAVEVGKFFEAHALVAYGQYRSPDIMDAERLLRKLGDVDGTELTKRELNRRVKGSTNFQKAEDLEPGLKVLEFYGYIRVEKRSPSNGGGRPSEIIKLNPLYFDGEPAWMR